MARKPGNDISPRMRRAFFNGFCKAAREKGMSLSDYCQTLWEDDWKKAADILTKFLPTEKQVTGSVKHAHDHKHTHESVSETAEWVTGMLGTAKESETKKPRSH